MRSAFRLAQAAIPLFICLLHGFRAPAQEVAGDDPSAPPWPGGIMITAASWNAELLFDLSGSGNPGAGASAGFSVEGFPGWRRLGAGIDVGYRWLSLPDGRITPIPEARAGISYRIPVAGLFSVVPFLGCGVVPVFGSTGVSFSPDAAAGASFLFRLSGRNYLALGSFLQASTYPSMPIRLSLSMGSRSETPWLMRRTGCVPVIRSMTPIFSPDGDGFEDVFSMRIGVSGGERCASWRVRVLEPDGAVFKTWEGKGDPPGKISWNGLSDSGLLVEPAEDYGIVFETTGTAGSAGSAVGSVTVDILVIRMGERYKVRVPDIRFPSNSADLADGSSEWMVAANRSVLSRLLRLFSRFPEYSITIEGHANSVNWSDPAAFEKENLRILVPLSLARAKAVMGALVSMGLDADRINASGRGGDDPLFDFSDADNAWKNRRVEILLAKKSRPGAEPVR